MDSPLAQGSLALMAGNFIGTLADKVATLVDKRVRMLEALRAGERTGSLLDSLLGIFLHMGVLSLGTEFTISALPFIYGDAPSFVLFNIGLFATSQHLIEHLGTLNSLLFEEITTPPAHQEAAPASSDAAP